jgi:tetratricopeptide (TPR) repeat protein
MSIFSKLFGNNSSINQIKQNINSQNYFEGQKSFLIGKKLYSEALLDKLLSTERRKQKTIAALEFLDKAIEIGYDDVNVFSNRGMCLRDLHYDVDAIEDFNKCIDKDPFKASYYYDRAMTKRFIYDYQGSLKDFEKAIELSILNNDDTRYWNNYAKKTGWESVTKRYEFDLENLEYDISRTNEDLRQDMYQKALSEKVRGN